MMRLRDAFTLAYTKLRTRRIRLVVSLLVSSLLFSALVAGSLIVTGGLHSLDSFSKEGFSGRYILSGYYQNYTSGPMTGDIATMARAEQLEKEELAAKKAAAKRLNIAFDDKVVDQANSAVYTDPSGAKSLNPMSKFGQQAMAEHQANDPHKLSFEKFKQQVGGADHFYRGVTRNPSRMDAPTLTFVKDGKELYNTQNNGGMMAGGYGMMGSDRTGLQTMPEEWNLLDEGLLQPFLLPGQNLAIGGDGSLPIIASYSAAQETLKLSPLASQATAQEKRTRLEEVRQKIAGQTFTICYRNATSNREFQDMLQQQETIKQNMGKPGFEKPVLIYKQAGSACQAPVVERDVRTAEEKRYAGRQEEFDGQFGKVAPASQLITFRIVGVTQDSPYSNSSVVAGGMSDILMQVLGSSIGARWVSPMTVLNNSMAAKDVFAISPVQLYASQEAYFAEYSNAQTARSVLAEKSCQPDFGGPQAESANSSKLPTCSLVGSSYMLHPFGSASLAIDDLKKSFHDAQFWVAIIVGAIATVILVGMIGRIIADARKETAVFRATGATRFMVAQIYIAYTLFLVMLMVLFSLVIGFAVAVWFNSTYSSDVSINMALLFNIADLSKQFTFYGLEGYDIGVIVLTVLSASLIGALVPIMLNIRRNPIRDMRDE